MSLIYLKNEPRSIWGSRCCRNCYHSLPHCWDSASDTVLFLLCAKLFIMIPIFYNSGDQGCYNQGNFGLSLCSWPSSSTVGMQLDFPLKLGIESRNLDSPPHLLRGLRVTPCATSCLHLLLPSSYFYFSKVYCYNCSGKRRAVFVTLKCSSRAEIFLPWE